jgi:hypothetical protein
MDPQDKQNVERAIVAARDGIGQSIDELDRQLRRTLDVKSLAAEHAPQLVAGGAVVGFLVGFGMPRALKRIIQVGVPVALVAWKAKQIYERRSAESPSGGRASEG